MRNRRLCAPTSRRPATLLFTLSLAGCHPSLADDGSDAAPAVATDAGPVASDAASPTEGEAAAAAPNAGVGAAADLSAPHIDGEPWVVAHNPDLGPLTGQGQQPVDFGLWQAADGTWQLWSCIRNANVPGQTRLFYRWEGQHLTDSDWKPMGIAMQADPSVGETEGGLQAPFVLNVAGTWHMLYGDYEHICHAVSQDGKNFTRVVSAGSTALFSEGPFLNTRDPMALYEEGLFRVYDTDILGAVYLRTSRDLSAFSAPQRVAHGGSAGIGWSSAECPFVVRPNAAGPYFLLRTQQYGANAQTSVYRAPGPDDFGIDDDRYLVGRLPVAAPELIQTEGSWYIAYLSQDLQGIQIARLRWQ